MQPVFPNLFLVGAMKAGTSSLHEYLQQHPQIFMSRFKEPQYFAPHRTEYGMWGEGQALPEAGVEWYLRLFAEAAGAVYAGESSVSYTARHWVSGCEERIWRFNPEARIVYLMRDPVERAVSHYWHFVAAGRETLGPLAALRGRDDYVARSDYAWQIEPYLRRFGEERVYLLTVEELDADPRGTFARLFAWLGVDDRVEIDASERHNVRERELLQTRRLARPLVRMMQGWRWKQIAGRVPRGVVRMLEAAAYRPVDRAKFDMSEARGYLEGRLAPRVKAVERLMGRRMVEWPRFAGGGEEHWRDARGTQPDGVSYAAQIDNK